MADTLHRFHTLLCDCARAQAAQRPVLSDSFVISVKAVLVPVWFLEMPCCHWSICQDRDELGLVYFHDYTS